MRHDHLNLEDSPCESAEDYKFSDCVESFAMEEVGCKPPWRRFEIDHLPVCSNLSQVVEYSTVYEKYATMPQMKLITQTKCLYPCSYMEYKVISC